MHGMLATSSSDGGSAALVLILIGIALWILMVAAMWKIFTKAGEAGWKSIIPIWSTIVMLRIVGRPLWWIVLLLIPLVNLVVWIIVLNDLSKSFGHGAGFTIGLLFLPFIFFLILGLGGDRYAGPAGAGRMVMGSPPPPPPPAY